MRRTVPLILAAAVVAAVPSTASAGKGGGGNGNTCTKGCDKAAPTVAISSPQDGAALSGTIAVSGTAGDNKKVVDVQVRVDDGGFVTADGTAAWQTAIATTAFADGAHSITARATDGSGNTASTTIMVSTSNALPPDTTAPSIAIATPTDGAQVSGTVTVAGVATDDTQLASVKIRVDGGTATSAVGTTTWSATLTTDTYGDGAHQIAAVAVDTAGNTSQITETLSFANDAASPSPTATPASTATPSPTPSPSPSPSVSPTSSPSTVPSPAPSGAHLVTPEGVTIDVSSAGPWTAQQVYDLLKQSAIQLDLIGPNLSIKVQDTTASQTTTVATSSGGRYTSYHATMYLKGVDSIFVTQPEATIAHEYGHAWTLYHLYLTHNGDWSSYLNARWTTADGSSVLASDPRLDSTYAWMRSEIIADDYRLLFGSPLAVSERPVHLNGEIPAPGSVSGLRSFLLQSWGGGATA